MRLPRRGSFSETLLTSLVPTAAAIGWINELLGDGPLGAAGLVLGTVALLLAVAFQLLSNRF